jgi:ATP-dependent HslUV protease ATP-binding subunit HslU
MNLLLENIGARRLHSLIEKVMEDISFEAGNGDLQSIIIDEKYVKEKLSKL